MRMGGAMLKQLRQKQLATSESVSVGGPTECQQQGIKKGDDGNGESSARNG
jgi:hypothetical protein